MKTEDLPKQSECGTFYGVPGPAIEAQLVYAELPFHLRLDWALETTTRRLRLHKKCAPAFVAAMTETWAKYGAARHQAKASQHAGTAGHVSGDNRLLTGWAKARQGRSGLHRRP